MANLRHISLLGVSLVSVALAGVAHAQAAPTAASTTSAPAPSDQGTASADANPAGEIVVTANKREEKQNSVGLTIQAATGSELTQRGIISPSDLTKLVPGFTFTQSLLSTPVYTLRGIGFYDPTFGAAPAVAIYTDQIPRNAAVDSDALDLDIARVEVLKGPQGTLFGQSATAGAINYVVEKPTKDLHYGMEASYERFGLATVDGYISGPISDSVQVRLAGKGQSGGAWQYSESRPDDHNGDTRKIEGRLTVDIEPSSDLKIELMATGSRDRSDPQAPQYTGSIFNTFPSAAAAAAAGDPYGVVNPAYYAALNTPGSPGYYPSFLTAQSTLLGRLNGGTATPNAAALQAGAMAILGTPIVNNNARAADWTAGLLTPSNNPYYQFAARIDYNLSPTITLTSLTAYARKGENYNQSLTGTTARDVNVSLFGNVRSFNEELHLAGNTSTFHWIVGGTYDKIDSTQDNYYYLQDYSGNAGGLIAITYNQLDTRMESYAGFANGEYSIDTHLSVQGGIRYTENRQSAAYCYSDPAIDTPQGTSFVFGQFLNATPTAIAPGQCFPVAPNGYSTLTPVHETLNQGNFSFRAGANYKFDQGTLLYAVVSQGYKAGVFSAIGASKTSQYSPAVQERLRALEAGIKAPLFDHRLQLNGAAFYYDYANKQTEVFINDAVFGTLEKLVNVPKSRIFGVEGELSARVFQRLRLSAGATYLDSKVTSNFSAAADGTPVYNDQSYTGNFKGSQLPYTPKFSGNVDAEYDMPINGSVSGFLGGTVVYMGSENGTFGTTALPSDQFEIPGYTTLDLRAGATAEDGRWRVQAYGRNVTNTVYTTSVSEYHDTSIRFRGKPAIYGLLVAFKY